MRLFSPKEAPCFARRTNVSIDTILYNPKLEEEVNDYGEAYLVAQQMARGAIVCPHDRESKGLRSALSS